MTVITEPGVPWRHVLSGTTMISWLSWDSGSPLELTLGFQMGDEAVIWVFGRDLVTEARVGGEAGLGDVRVSIHGGTLLLELISPFGKAVLETSSAVIEGFVMRTFSLVPAGEEFDYLPLSNPELENWLGNGR
jgi:hypothetical protein